MVDSSNKLWKPIVMGSAMNHGFLFLQCHNICHNIPPITMVYARVNKVEINVRRKFRSQTSDNMDRWKAEEGRGREKRKIRREKIRRERVRGQKIDALEIIVRRGNHPQMAARFRLVKYDNLPRYMYPIYIFRVIPGPTRHFFALLCSRSPAAWWVQRRGSHSRLRTRGAVAIGAGTSARHGETVKLFTRWKCREPWWDIPGLVNIYVTMENHQFLMRKSPISTGPFSIANCLFTRG